MNDMFGIECLGPMNRAFSARVGFGDVKPRALPWAGMIQAFGLGNGRGMRISLLLFVLLIFSTTLSPAHAGEKIDFNRQIRPLLFGSCATCHGPDQDERKADLRLDTVDGSRKDLGGYAAVVPGNPSKSELIRRITTDDEDDLMPPKDKGRRFNAKEIATLKKWIEQGGDYAGHWSYQKPKRPEVPVVANPDWPRNELDYFVLAQLEKKGLKPSPEADRWTLARRAAIDLTGLPPTWEAAQKFADDKRPEAFERYVDRQLAKDAFGERWARVWLDLARYADSAGYADDPARTIWAFRDYVIRSLNDNKPFDQFTVEQIAGDLLDNPTEEQLIATAFNRNTQTNSEGGTDDEEFRNVAVVDRVNTTMAVWMGATMACAQCHTHKYDPFTQEEYFKMFAIFNQSQDTDKKDERPALAIWSEKQEEDKATWQTRITELKKTLATETPALAEARSMWLEGLRQEPKWTPLKASSAKARSVKLNIGDDGVIATKDDLPDNELYTLRFPTTKGTLTGLRLEIPADQKNNFVLSQATASWTPNGSQARNGRYVRVELPGPKRFLHLAEVQAFSGGVNVALKGKATQSSQYSDAAASRANDGKTDGDYYKLSVSHTAEEKDPWLEIDLGSTQSIDKIVLWNRTDGGAATGARLKGFHVKLLDEKRAVVFEQTPDALPAPSATYAMSGAVTLQFAAAFADYEQSEFTAQSAIQAKLDKNKGWAIGSQPGKPHDLSLMLKSPLKAADGTLTLRLNQASVHKKHLITHFRISTTSDKNASVWARMPQAVRAAVRKTKRSAAEEKQLAEYYRGIAPALASNHRELARFEKLLASAKPYTSVPVMRDVDAKMQRETRVQIRGNFKNTAQVVEAGVPAALHALPKGAAADRLGLARWLVDDDNPLTPRVIANRHWEQIFGIGIVETSEEFGSQGELPSHPELLDWLAVDLRDSGWDLKRFIKLLVTSATYRQSSKVSDALIEADPFNRLLARGPRFRISAEMVRDQALAVSGLLSRKMGGTPAKPPQPKLGLKAAFGSATDWKTSMGEDKYRRGIYTTWRRSSPYPSMATFDAPNREVCTVRRTRTNTPLQALVTLNDPVYVEAAQALARQMVASAKSPEDRIRHGIRACLLREPNAGEIDRLVKLYKSARDKFAKAPAEAKLLAEQPLGALPEGADPVDMAAWTLVGNVLLNLDEMFLKR